MVMKLESIAEINYKNNLAIRKEMKFASESISLNNQNNYSQSFRLSCECDSWEGCHGNACYNVVYGKSINKN